ncbi:MAG: hydrophobic protein [Acidimicrobiia bacterium]|nr:hydrophobic protein [Acidimicrobiia bacterium]
MGVIVLALLLVLLFGGLGFAVHILWLLAAVLLVLWVIGFLARGAEGARWYRW